MTERKMPERPTLEGLEDKWSALWEQAGTYRFDRSRPRPEVYAIDTPPPTVSGSLHVGHVFSYTQTDVIARFHRMRGKAVFYPIGWDDNGLATERRVQIFYGVRCDPTVAYDPGFEPPATAPKDPISISRPNFVELCFRLTAEDERAFETLWRRVGLSFDWTQQYTTVGDRARRTSQAAFLNNLARKEAYRSEAPTLWDVDFRTSVAQAELEDRERPGAYFRIRFPRAGEDDSNAVEIETTRPELVPACVALVAHPSDERYQALFGTEVTTPLFGVRVPVLSHHLADPEKGSGIAMVCTFGDLTDVVWWRELGLPTRTIVERDGRLGHAPFGEPGWETADPERARAQYSEIEGKTVKAAQNRIVELLGESGDLLGEPRPITHAVKFYEKGDRPLEIVSSRQWYLRTMPMREALLERGRQLHWVPGFMGVRYENWVEGLTGDWNISRQRFFGVPFPVWYRLDDSGEPVDDEPILPELADLPIDPSTVAPPGFDESDRGKPGGFVGDPDVMDTWATSSLTPQIAGGWLDDPDLFARVYPMDLRPQAHDIIRTWLFSTVVRSQLEHDELPWKAANISGFILDPDRKKLGKSKGNAVLPTEALDAHGTDAVRYWAASARLGMDAAYDMQQMKVGRRLAIKLLNVTRFVLSRIESGPLAGEPELLPTDASLLAGLDEVVTDATAAFERYDYARALEITETFFWRYCDDYVELVKSRAYGDPSEVATRSAAFTLSVSLSVLLRLFAPVISFAAEEAWSWWQDGSIHLAEWPATSGAGSEPRLLGVLSEALALVRKAKSEAKVSMRAPISRAVLRGARGDLELLGLATADLCEAGVIAVLELEAADQAEMTIEVEFAPEP